MKTGAEQIMFFYSSMPHLDTWNLNEYSTMMEIIVMDYGED